MDWHETDPLPLRDPQSSLTLNTEETPDTAATPSVPFAPPAGSHFASQSSPLWHDMAQGENLQAGQAPISAYPYPVYQSPVPASESQSVLQPNAPTSFGPHSLAFPAAPAPLNSPLIAPPASVFAPGAQAETMVQAEAVNAVIWQKLSHLVHTPPRFDGIWPFLTFVASIGIFVSLIVTNVWMLLPWLLMLSASLKINRAHAVKEHARDALNMAPFDLRWVGPLAQAINSPHSRVQGVSTQILSHLLPHLRPADAGLLNAQQRAALNQRLIENKGRDSDLNVAILAAWENVGDQESVAYVDRLAHGRAWQGGQRQVQEAARKCLPQLEKRLEEEQAARVSSGEAVREEKAENAIQTAGTRAVNKKVSEQLEKLDEERRKHTNPGMRMGFLIASWVFIVPYTAWMAYTTFDTNWKLGVSWAVLSLISTQLHRLTLSLRQSEEAKKLAQMDDVRGVGTLAEALEWPDASTQRVAAAALTKLLPRMTASDGTLLNAKQRATLYNILRKRNARSQEPLIKAILQALKQVGDHAAIPAVERLMDLPATSQRNIRIRTLAIDTRQFLDTTAQQQSISSTLLRASSAHETPSELLLRGAMLNSDEAPQQLLRASVSEDKGG